MQDELRASRVSPVPEANRSEKAAVRQFRDGACARHEIVVNNTDTAGNSITRIEVFERCLRPAQRLGQGRHRGSLAQRQSAVQMQRCVLGKGGSLPPWEAGDPYASLLA
jgi:hypothetical protein